MYKYLYIFIAIKITFPQTSGDQIFFNSFKNCIALYFRIKDNDLVKSFDRHFFYNVDQ